MGPRTTVVPAHDCQRWRNLILRAVKRGRASDVVEIRHGSAGALQILVNLPYE
jgi:hypothetical protein